MIVTDNIMLQIQMLLCNRTQPSKLLPQFVQLDKRRTWNKGWLQLLYIRRFMRIIFPEFLNKGFHWQGSKRLSCPFTRNIGLTPYWCTTTRLIVLQDIRGSNKSHIRFIKQMRTDVNNGYLLKFKLNLQRTRKEC